MCGRFTLTTEIGTNLLASLFDSRSKIDDLSPRYNIAPKQTTAAVLVEREERVLDKLQWGLLPPWFTATSVSLRILSHGTRPPEIPFVPLI